MVINCVVVPSNLPANMVSWFSLINSPNQSPNHRKVVDLFFVQFSKSCSHLCIQLTICSPDLAGFQIEHFEIVTLNCKFCAALSPSTAGSGATWVGQSIIFSIFYFHIEVFRCFIFLIYMILDMPRYKKYIPALQRGL